MRGSDHRLRHRQVADVSAMATVVTATVVAATTLAAGPAVFRSADPGTSFERAHPQLPVLLAVGLVAAIGGGWLLLAQRPGAAVPLSAAVTVTTVAWWAGWPWLAPQVRAAVLALPLVAAPCLAAAVQGWGGRTRVGHNRLVVLSVLSGLTAAGMHLLAYDPLTDLACLRTCRAVDVPVGTSVERPLLIGARWLGVLAAVLALAAVARATSIVPGLVRAAVAAGLTVLAGTIAGAALSLHETRVPADLLELAAVLLAAAAAGTAAVRQLHRRRAANRLIALIGEASTGATDRNHGRRPSRHPARQGGGRTRSVVGVADTGVDPTALTPAQRLTLVNSRLSARASARLAAARSAQRRALDVADRERARIERDLHDGAQQQLVTAALHLAVASTHLPRHTAGELTAMRDQVGGILEALRAISHGPFPPVLEEEGLAAALQELAAENPGRFHLGGPETPAACDGGVARATYAVATDLLDTCDPGGVTVQGDSTAVRVSANVAPGQPDDAVPGSGPQYLTRSTRDRIEALAGAIEVVIDGGATHVKVTIPCA